MTIWHTLKLRLRVRWLNFGIGFLQALFLIMILCNIYLERYANDLSTCKISNIATVTEEIMHIYQSLKETHVMSDSPYVWCANALPKVRSI